MTTGNSDITPDHPKARGTRLKRVRNLANQPRQDLCQRENINFNTYKGWEIGRHGGLTPQAAEMLVTVFGRYGVICTAEWLLEETGTPPQVITDFEPHANASTQSNEASQIKNEILFLKQAYTTLIIHQIDDDHMSPFFLKNDYVAGCPQTSYFKKLANKPVIALLEKNKYVVRVLRHCDTHNTWCLFSNLNKQHDIHKPTLSQIAMIIWHRRSLQ